MHDAHLLCRMELHLQLPVVAHQSNVTSACFVSLTRTPREKKATTVTEVTLEGRGELNLACDWGVGIGGGLWSTGLLLIEHLCKHAALYDEVLKGKRVLELGSGTGLVGERQTEGGPW